MTDYAVLIAARMTSERLPGKALSVYCPDGTTNLEQIIHRWQRMSRRQPLVIIATSTDKEDDIIAFMCDEMHQPCHRGSRDDVATRLNGALLRFASEAKWIARGMSDSPLVDVGLADHRLDRLMDTGADGFDIDEYDVKRLTYAATTDVWSRAAWDRIVVESRGDEREHVGAYYWDHIDRFKTIPYPLPMREYFADVRTELDTPEDLEMFKALWKTVNDYGFNETSALNMIATLIDRPEISSINSSVTLKTQSRANWRKGSRFHCKNCQRRMGSVVNGDLMIGCPHCGARQKFYTSRPIKASMLGY